MTTLAELEERRENECRLTPDRALETLDEAEEFFRDRGLLTRTADSALPSLFEACHEEPYARESPGFGQWPATKFPWFGQLGARGHLILAVHRGKSLLVTDEVAALLDPICRAELARMAAAEEGWAPAARAPRRRRPFRARGPPDGAGPDTEGAQEPPLAARALRGGRRAAARLRGAPPAYEPPRSAGTRRTRSRAARATRGRRSETSSAPAFARPSSHRSASSRAGSPGAGTGTTA